MADESPEAKTQAGAPAAEAAAGKKKKIAKMSAEEVEQALKKAKETMGGACSQYAAHLQKRKAVLLQS